MAGKAGFGIGEKDMETTKSANAMISTLIVAIFTGIVTAVGFYAATPFDAKQVMADTGEENPEGIGAAEGAEHIFDTDFPIADVVLTDAQETATQEAEPETKTKDAKEEADASALDASENEYANLAIANVQDYVNVRSAPGTDSEIVGKMYHGSVAQVLAIAGENNEWLQVVSGSVEGYIKAEYFIYGDAAAQAAQDYVIRYAVVKADRLNVRQEPDIASKRIGYIDNGERVKLAEWGDAWSVVNYAGDKQGYVSSEFITVAEEFIYAKSIEEEKAELAALQKQQERTQISEEAAPERMVISAPPTDYANVSDLRNAIVAYAMQFLGNRYVHGGRSLAAGTDCSGFTCYVYQMFGYGLSRTPQGQHTSAGRRIDISQIQPGDIICYTSNGSSCTHVGLYIGNGQIIHSANSRKGVILSAYNYNPNIMSIHSIVD